MGHEHNLDSIQAVEKEIENHELVISKLKQASNSPLNISTLIPPEILGNIFYWTVDLQREHSTSQKIPHNLLFVCRHWFEVALRTPQLWTSWGDSLQEWERRYACPRVPNLNLELAEVYSLEGRSISEPLRDALRDRAARDLIRRVYLCIEDSALYSITSAITTGGGEIQQTNLESFEVHHLLGFGSTVDLSDFFSRYRFPKLRRIGLSGHCSISSWESLASRTTALVALSLAVEDCCSTPTASQLISILSSNPNLQYLKLSPAVLPNFNSGESSFQVQLDHLKRIELRGDSRNSLQLLNRLRPANKLDCLKLDMFCHSTSGISQTLAWYLGDHILRRGNLQGGLAIRGHSDQMYFLRVGDVERINNCPPSGGVNWFMEISGFLVGDGRTQGEESQKLFLDSIAHIRDHIVYYNSACSPMTSVELLTGMTNLIEIWISEPISLSEWFVEPDPGIAHAYGELLPSLQYLSFTPRFCEGDWSPLTTFLSRRASVGNRLKFLTINRCPHMCPGVVDDITRAVQYLNVLWRDDIDDGFCPYGKCSHHSG